MTIQNIINLYAYPFRTCSLENFRGDVNGRDSLHSLNIPYTLSRMTKTMNSRWMKHQREYLLSIYDFILINVLQDPDLEGQLDKMEELDEFEPDEVNGGLVFSEDEEDMVNPDDKDDWQRLVA